MRLQHPLLHLLRQLLHSPDMPRETQDWFVVVVRSGNERVGLCVDATVEMTEIVIKSLGEGLGHTAGVVGASILADGHPGLILDVADVIRLAIGHYRGRMSEVARRLGIGRSTLYRKLADLGIDTAA